MFVFKRSGEHPGLALSRALTGRTRGRARLLAGCNRKILRTAMLGCLVLPVCSEALAQALTSDKTPPPLQLTDRNGVDLHSGALVRPGVAITIGETSSPSLRFAPYNINYKAGNTPFISRVEYNICNPNQDIIVTGCKNYYNVVLNDRNATFVEYGSAATIKGIEGDTLDLSNPSAFTVLAKDGLKWEFDRRPPPDVFYTSLTILGRIRKITNRDGSTLILQEASPGGRSW